MESDYSTIAVLGRGLANSKLYREFLSLHSYSPKNSFYVTPRDKSFFFFIENGDSKTAKKYKQKQMFCERIGCTTSGSFHITWLWIPCFTLMHVSSGKSPTNPSATLDKNDNQKFWTASIVYIYLLIWSTDDITCFENAEENKIWPKHSGLLPYCSSSNPIFRFLPVTMLRIKLSELSLHTDRPAVGAVISAALNAVPLLWGGAPAKSDLFWRSRLKSLELCQNDCIRDNKQWQDTVHIRTQFQADWDGV